MARLLQFGVKYKKEGFFLYQNFSNRFCSKVESPDIPDWFKITDKGESDDDFVLPTKTFSSGYKESSCYRNSSHETDDSSIDVVSNILKDNFISPGLVVKTLSARCAVKISVNMVEKILKRFSNDWVSAFGFFLWAQGEIGYKHSTESFDTMVDILGKFKQFDLMFGLVKEMVNDGGLVSLATMTKVMRRLAKACRWCEAIQTFHNLDRFGVKKDVESMNVILDTLCKERSVTHASKLFLHLRKEIMPNATSFNVMVHGWCFARRLVEAQETVSEMKRYGFNPCVITYTSLVEAYCLEKNFEKVYGILEEMQVQECSPNIVTFTIIMHSLGKANRVDEALGIFDRVKKEKCIPDTSFYNSLIFILCKSKRVQDAYTIYKEMCKKGVIPNVTTYNTLISANCRCYQEKEALKLLSEMEEDLCKPDIKTYTPLLKMCCEKQWTKTILYLIGHMFKKDISLDYSTYILLINGLCRNGMLVQSCKLFKEVVMKGSIPNELTYSMLLEALEREQMNSAKKMVVQLMTHARKMRGNFS